MKFKRNICYLQGLIGISIFCSLIFIILLITSSMDMTVVSLCFTTPIWFMLLFEIVSKGSLFYDTVICNERGITIVTRKKTYDCPWEQIKLLDQINGKSGPIGWTVVTNSQEKIRIMTSSRGFIRYVKKVAPYVKITNPWDVNYGVKL